MDKSSFYVRDVYKTYDLHVCVYEEGVMVDMINKRPEERRSRTVSKGFEWKDIEAEEAEIWADDNW